MKKLLAIIALVLSCVCLFVACDVATYQSDADYHWVQGNESAKAPHAWDKGEVIKEATETESGERRFTCTVCGYQLTQEIPSAHTHTYAHGWSSDKFGHWHAGTCEHPEAQGDFAEHTFDGGVVVEPATSALTGTVVYICTVCGWQKTEEIAPDHTDHIWTWNTTFTEHWQEKACCDAADVKNRGEHTYDENHVCTVCGQYSVIEAIKGELANWSGDTLVISDVKIGSLAVDELAINFAFDSSANLVGQAYLDFVQVDSADADGSQGVRQTFDVVLRDGVFYVKSADYKADGVTVAHTGYSKLSPSEALKKLLKLFGVDYDESFEEQIATYSAEIINRIYAASDDIKAVLDVLEDAVASIPELDYEQVLSRYFFKEVIDGQTYRLNFAVFGQLNAQYSKITVGDVLEEILGTDDLTTAVSAAISNAFDVTVGEVLDVLKAQGVDLYELNEQINEILASFNLSLESIVEESAGLPIPDGLLVADYLDSVVVRAFKVRDIVKAIFGDELTEAQVVAFALQIIENYADYTLYDVICGLSSSYYLNIVQTASLSADIQEVRYLYTQLLVSAKDMTSPTNEDVIAVLMNGDLDMQASAYGHEIYWCEDAKQFVLVSKIDNVSVAFPYDAVITNDMMLYQFDTEGNQICKVTLRDISTVEALPICTGETMRVAFDQVFALLNDFVAVRIQLNDDLTAVIGWSVELDLNEVSSADKTPITGDIYGQQIVGLFDQVRMVLSLVKGKIESVADYTFTNSADSIINDVDKYWGNKLAA